MHHNNMTNDIYIIYMYYITHVSRLLLMSTSSLRQRSVFLCHVQGSFVPQTVSLRHISTHRVYYSEFLGVFAKFRHVRVFASSNSSALASKKLFEGIPRKPLTQLRFNTRDLEHQLGDFNK